jgi:DNA-binding transcriptional LysR family regulator
MKPNQLRAFLTVVEQHSIRGAARELGVSQPAITSAMRELEADLGVPLLERSVAGVRCTPYGEAFEPRARLMLSEMQSSRDELQQLRDGDVGRVSVAFGTAIAHTLLPRVFEAFRVQSPGVAIRLSEASLPTSYAKLRDGSLDLLVSHMMEGSQDEFQLTSLYTAQPVIVAREGHPMAGCTRLSELRAMEWLLPYDSQTAPQLLQRFFEASGNPVPERILQCTSTAMALRLAGTQDVVAWFVDSLPEAEFRHWGIRRIPIVDRLPAFEVGILTRPQSVLTPAAQRFFDCVCRAARALAAGTPATGA